MADLEKCSSEPCKDVREELDNGAMNLDSLPVNLPDPIYRVDQAHVNKMASKINASVDRIRPKISDKMDEMRKELDGHDETVRKYLSDFDELLEWGESNIQEAEPYIEEYGGYPYYIGMELSRITTITG